MDCKKAAWAGFLFFLLILAGCGPVEEDTEPLVDELDLGSTIGSEAEVFALEAVAVEGYSIVGGLHGTGSQECPSALRNYLEQYILRYLPKADVEGMISSMDTAVVRVRGIMPAAVADSRRFDVKVESLPGTQTTSLVGGQLYGVELRQAGRYNLGTKVLAEAEGPVYIDRIGDGADKRTGYVLGSGRVLDDYNISLHLKRPDHETAKMIQDRLNGRFGSRTAKGMTRDIVVLQVPAGYQNQKRRFVTVLRQIYLKSNEQIEQQRISEHVRKLATSENKYRHEAALEAIGRASIGKLSVLLNSSNEDVQFHVGRCLLNLGSDEGFKALSKMAMTDGHKWRLAALEAITTAGRRDDASAVARELLNDEDFDVRLAAYEQLRKLDDIAISQEMIGGRFLLEQLAQTPYKGVFVARSGRPRVVLFGEPLYCERDLFVQSDDGEVTLNAIPGENGVTVIRKHPDRPNIAPIQIRTSYRLSDVIRVMCESPMANREAGIRPGLGISYSYATEILEKLCRADGVKAEFRAGKMAQVGEIVKPR